MCTDGRRERGTVGLLDESRAGPDASNDVIGRIEAQIPDTVLFGSNLMLHNSECRALSQALEILKGFRTATPLLRRTGTDTREIRPTNNFCITLIPTSLCKLTHLCVSDFGSVRVVRLKLGKSGN